MKANTEKLAKEAKILVFSVKVSSTKPTGVFYVYFQVVGLTVISFNFLFSGTYFKTVCLCITALTFLEHAL